MKFRLCDGAASHLPYFNSFPPFENQFWLFVIIVKNKLTSVFYASVLLLMINFVITLSKFVVDPFAYLRLLDLQHFDNVMTQFIINNRTDA